ncbi:4Fe-4S binding protein [Endothiovibrio diazotrophicus]
MSKLNDLAIRLYRRLFGAKDHYAFGGVADGVLDGHTAVAVSEAMLAEAAAFGGALAAARLGWQQGRREALASDGAEGPRGALAAAMGRALAGQRACVFLDGPELASAVDLLANAAGRHLPLVVQLTNRALPAHGESAGTGHEALHLAGESGCVVLVAANVQEAVDLTLIAHRIAERALCPVAVAQDNELTALAPQEVSLAAAELVARFLGDADDEIDAPTPSQQLLFGDRRRRLPRWHDLDQPMLTGARQSTTAFALGATAAGPFFDDHVGALVDEAFAEFTRLTGRPYGRLWTHRMEGAERVLLLQGAAVESARAIADRRHKERLGVVGVRCLRPAPGAALVEALAGRSAVAVMERGEAHLGDDGPLARELRAALDRALENGRHGADCHPGYPPLTEAKRPRLHRVCYGSGGLPLRAADLAALCDRLRDGAPNRLVLGVDFHANTPEHPKRQVMLDRLRRAYPALAGMGLRGATPTDLRPEGALSLAIFHRGEAHALVGEAGTLLQRLAGGMTRGRPGLDGDPWSRDRLIHAPAGPGYPGDDAPVDAALVAGGEGLAAADLCADLVEGGVLVICGEGEGSALWADLGPRNREAIAKRSLRLYRLAADAGEEPDDSFDPLAVERSGARRLGALFAALVASERLDSSRRKLVAAREESLAALDEAERGLLTAEFEAGFDAVESLDYAALAAPEALPAPAEETPLAVRHLGGSDETYESLPRFWDQVGVLYRDGEADRLTADPYLATGAVPPLSATFRDLSAGRSMLPRFAAEHCTGCGECWSACPDSAIGAVALTPAALVNAGIQATKGDPLRPLASKLAGRVSAMGRAGEFRGAAAGELITAAWAWLQEKAPLAEERLAAVQPAIERLAAWAGQLPLAMTEILFKGGEKVKKDDGELLSLAINPDACKGCGLCVTLCAEEALIAEPQQGTHLDAARALWRTWQETPDTASATIERLREGGELSAMAAIQLSRYCALAMAGGDPAEPGSGEKIALRMALAATEYQQQPLLHRFTLELGELRERITEKVRDTLSAALPADDLDALERKLRGAPGKQIDLSAFEGAKGVETARMRRLVELARGLNDQYQRLSAGRYGLGRARFGLAVAAGSVAEWAGAFPNNPFQAPVVLDMTGDAGQLAAGVLAGQLAVALRAIGLMEQAREELGEGRRGKEAKGQNGGTNPLASSPLSPLAWSDLTEEQKRVCPPLILMGNEAELGGRGLSQVAWLLNSGLPVKILVLSELELGLDTRGVAARPLGTLNDPRSDLGLMALAQRNGFVAQTSIGDADHYRESLRRALRYTGPALIRVHAPSPARHGFAADGAVARARQAVASRAFPLFRYDPSGKGVFGSRLDLDGNPDACEPWAAGEGGALLPVHWAAGESRFAAHFAPLADDAASPAEASAWLALDAKAREKRTPYVELTGKRYRVSGELLVQTERLQHAWRTLQELGGLVTPFTERVQREAEERVAAEHQTALAAQRAEYEAKLGDQAAGMQGQMAAEIKQRLMSLAGYQ